MLGTSTESHLTRYRNTKYKRSVQ